MVVNRFKNINRTIGDFMGIVTWAAAKQKERPCVKTTKQRPEDKFTSLRDQFVKLIRTVKELGRGTMKKLNELTELFILEKQPRIMKFMEGVAVLWKRNKTEENTLRRVRSESSLRSETKLLPYHENEEKGCEGKELSTKTTATYRRTVRVQHSPLRTRTEIVPVKSCIRHEQQDTTASPTQICKRVTFSIYALILSAASQDSVSELKELLDKKPSYLNKPSSSGETALHKAAAKGNLECIKLLVQRGADVNMPDKQGRTPLLLSWANGHFECHKLMLTSLKESDKDSPERIF